MRSRRARAEPASPPPAPRARQGNGNGAPRPFPVSSRAHLEGDATQGLAIGADVEEDNGVGHGETRAEQQTHVRAAGAAQQNERGAPPPLI